MVLVELATLKSNYLVGTHLCMYAIIIVVVVYSMQHRINRTESALNQSLPEHMVIFHSSSTFTPISLGTIGECANTPYNTQGHFH